VQIRTDEIAPLGLTARTERRFGSERVFDLLFAWETVLPTSGPFPQISQRRAMVVNL
jgi:hypothetical protein